jgi:hypothetical protein
MKKSWQVAAITLGMSVALVSSSFAAQALTDDEMDKATAKGQSAVLKNSSGDQTILDNSLASVELHENAQQELTAGTAVNAAGENNIATAVNAAKVVTGDVSQNNDIWQSKAASVEQDNTQFNTLDTTDNTATKTSSKSTQNAHSLATTHEEGQRASSSSSESESASSRGLTIVVNVSATRSLSYSEAFPANVSVALTGTIGATADAQANADATGTGTANSTATTTTTTTQTATKTSETASLADNAAQATATTPIVRNPSEQQISANITKNHDVAASDAQTYQTVATGEAAISKAVTQGDQQAYAVGAAKSETVVDVRLPVARTVTADSSLTIDNSSLNANSTSSSSSSSASESAESRSRDSSTETTQSATAEFSAEAQTASTSKSDQTLVNTESIVADHVVIGSGNQSITDNTLYTVLLDGNAQQDAVALNIFNVAGRNNVAAAWNMATSENDLINVGGTLTQVNTIKQTN